MGGVRGNVAFDARATVRVIRGLVASAVLATALVAGQEPRAPVVSDRAGFARAMVRADDAWAIVSEAIEGPSFLLNSVRGDGLARLDVVSDSLRGARGFFEVRSRPDAVALADDALRAVAELRVELARAEPDQAAALEAVEPVRVACAACHRRYRDGDAQQGFRFKPGVVD